MKMSMNLSGLIFGNNPNMPMQCWSISKRPNFYETLKEGSSKNFFNYENVNEFVGPYLCPNCLQKLHNFIHVDRHIPTCWT